MHQKQPATAAGGKACSGLLQRITGASISMQRQNLTLAETVSSAHHILLQGGSHGDLEGGSFQVDFDALQFKSI